MWLPLCYRKLPFSNGQPYSGCSTLLYKALSSSRQPWLTMSTTTLATATTATSNKCLSTCNFKYHGVLFTFEVGCINYWHTFYQNFGFTHKNLQLPQSNGSRSNSQLELQQKLYTSVERNRVMSNIELDISSVTSQRYVKSRRGSVIIYNVYGVRKDRVTPSVSK